MDALKGVITGDLVGSSKFTDYRKVVRSLEVVLSELEEWGWILPGMWEVFRGDSFQVLMAPEDVFTGAVLIRAGLIGRVYRLRSPLILDEVLDASLDARMGVGLGEVEMSGRRVTDLFGEGLMVSGLMLDRLSQESLRWVVVTSDESLNPHFEMVSLLSDRLTREWTVKSARALYRHLLTGETQQEMASYFQISQSSVHHRLRCARFDEFSALQDYFGAQVKQLSKRYAGEGDSSGGV